MSVAGRRIVLALTLAAVLALAACGDSASEDAPSATRTATNGDVFNDADVAFATDMIPHHAQALALVDLAQGRTLDPDVEALLEQIRAAQAPEIETMVDWLTAWDEEIPETMRDHANAHDPDHADMGDMPGMMSPEELDELEAAPDAAFQDMWLRMMIAHHEGAIEMAQDQQEHGAFGDAVELARDIEEGQRQEIEQMQAIIG